MSLSQVKSYWERQVCDSCNGVGKEGTEEYYRAIENARIASFDFSHPTLYSGKKVLEVGVGSGVDFVQWCKAGCDAYGIDLTEAAVAHTRGWLEFYHLPEHVQIANAEALPFPDNTFDLVYSWGVLHHSPDTQKAISECIRVCKPGGEIKLMLYNRRSLLAFGLWLKGLLHKHVTFTEAIAHEMENCGTKAFTVKEIRRMCSNVISIESKTNTYDKMLNMPYAIQLGAKAFNYITNERAGWFTTVRMIK